MNEEEKAVECCNHFTRTHSICPFVPVYRRAQKEPFVGRAALTVTHSHSYLNRSPSTVLLRVQCVFCMCVRLCGLAWPSSLSSDNSFQASLSGKMTDRQECGMTWTAERAAGPETTSVNFVYI